jgi:prepilin-type N-terminal cleavage/methylation domain-containing protein
MASPAAKGKMPTSAAGRTNRAHRRGITLIEMVVVVAIIAMIVGISFPAASAGVDNVRIV